MYEFMCYILTEIANYLIIGNWSLKVLFRRITVNHRPIEHNSQTLWTSIPMVRILQSAHPPRIFDRFRYSSVITLLMRTKLNLATRSKKMRDLSEIFNRIDKNLRWAAFY